MVSFEINLHLCHVVFVFTVNRFESFSGLCPVLDQNVRVRNSPFFDCSSLHAGGSVDQSSFSQVFNDTSSFGSCRRCRPPSPSLRTLSRKDKEPGSISVGGKGLVRWHSPVVCLSQVVFEKAKGGCGPVVSKGVNGGDCRGQPKRHGAKTEHPNQRVKKCVGHFVLQILKKFKGKFLFQFFEIKTSFHFIK